MASEDLTNVLLDGRYRLVRLIGQGGMGQVYEGIHETLGHKVAVKALLPKHAHDPKFRERFLREAKAASKVRHPNVVQIVDFGDTPAGSVYFVMEFLEGYDLKQLLAKEGRLGWERARPMLVQIASALAAAHERSIVHRDVKPANLFIVEQRGQPLVKVLDFGIAKLAASASTEQENSLALRLTNTGEVFGTAKYMAPEQAQGASDDPRVDIYALGVVAYELLTGHVPFSGRSPFDIISRHLSELPRPPTELVPELPPAVEAAILRALAKRPDDRFATMDAMEQALSAIAPRPRVPVTLPFIKSRVSPPAPARPGWSGPMAWGDTEAKPDVATVREEVSEPSIDEVTTANARANVSPDARPTLVDPAAPVASVPASARRTEPRPASSTAPTVAGPGITTLIPTDDPTDDPTAVEASAPGSTIATLIPTEGPAPTHAPEPRAPVAPSCEPSLTGAIRMRRTVFLSPTPLAPTFASSREPRTTQVGGQLITVVPSRLRLPTAIAGELVSSFEPARSAKGPMQWATQVVSDAGASAAMKAEGSSPLLHGAAGSASGSRSRVEAPLQAPPPERFRESVWWGLLSTIFGGVVVLAGVFAWSLLDRDDGAEAPAQPVGAALPAAPPTDDDVKSQLTRSLVEECGALGPGSAASIEILVGADGHVLGKSVTGASSELEACLLTAVASAQFPAGTTRTLVLAVAFP